MARTKKEENEVLETQGVMLDTTNEDEQTQVVVPVSAAAEEERSYAPSTAAQPNLGIQSCLRNERIIVRHIPKATGLVSDPKHVLYGGMAETAVRVFGVPRLTSGIFVNVLTKAEKDFLEQALGLEPNALSIHRKVDNFWDDSVDNGISTVRLSKQDNHFDLSNPEDYIRYKVLLANKAFIAPSLKELQDCPKASYQFVIINEGDEVRTAKAHMTSVQQCYMEYGKISEDFDTLRVIVETISSRPVAPSTKIDWLQTKTNELIQANPKMFLSVVTDSLLKTKVLIKKAAEVGIIAYRDQRLYLRETNMPLCEFNEEATLNNAAKYLANPKHQDVLFAIQAKLKA